MKTCVICNKMIESSRKKLCSKKCAAKRASDLQKERNRKRRTKGEECKICGLRFKYVGIHAATAHGMSAEEYKLTYKS